MKMSSKSNAVRKDEGYTKPEDSLDTRREMVAEITASNLSGPTKAKLIADVKGDDIEQFQQDVAASAASGEMP